MKLTAYFLNKEQMEDQKNGRPLDPNKLEKICSWEAGKAPGDVEAMDYVMKIAKEAYESGYAEGVGLQQEENRNGDY